MHMEWKVDVAGAQRGNRFSPESGWQPAATWPACQQVAGRPPYLFLPGKRVGKCKQHGNTNADQEGRVNQTDQKEHFGLQCVHQFGLTCGGFKVFATHYANSDAGADGTQSDDNTASKSN